MNLKCKKSSYKFEKKKKDDCLFFIGNRPSLYLIKMMNLFAQANSMVNICYMRYDSCYLLQKHTQEHDTYCKCYYGASQQHKCHHNF